MVTHKKPTSTFPFLPPHNTSVFQQAAEAHQRGDLDRAYNLYRRVLEREPGQAQAAYLFAMLHLQTGKFADAAELLERVVARQPQHSDAWSNLAAAMLASRNYARALEAAGKAVELQPAHADAWVNHGIALRQLVRPVDALRSFDEALQLNSAHVNAWTNKSSALLDLKRPLDALASADQALQLAPQLAQAWLNRATALFNLKRNDEAKVSVRRAIELRPDLTAAWITLGSLLADAGDTEAIACYQRALVLDPKSVEALSNLAVCLQARGRTEEAGALVEQALALDPQHAKAWHASGVLWLGTRHPRKALANFEHALALDPHNARCWIDRASAFQLLRQTDDIIFSLNKALEIEPGQPFALSTVLHFAQLSFDWQQVDQLLDSALKHAITSKEGANPFVFLAHPQATAVNQLQISSRYVARNVHAQGASPQRTVRPRSERLRIAYISADFKDHPMAYLMAEVFELHDRSRYEVTAVSITPQKESKMRPRLEAAFDHWIDVVDESSSRIAEMLHQRGIDIVVDLMGHTEWNRMDIFAQRCAPIQINFLGYPGTTGLPNMDYIIGDAYVTPGGSDAEFSEHIVRLPDTFQPNDRKRARPVGAMSRGALGLADEAFVYCCFNNGYKIQRPQFELWMRLLRQTPGSVLWLLASSQTAVERLRQAADAHGVSGDRLVFSERRPHAEYLASLSCADLFLDTLPFNAGTTASDALWNGLPVLTQTGHTFAGRMATSLLHAVALPELITTSDAAYEAKALHLAHAPADMRRIRAKLHDNISSAPLFDTPRYVRHLETAFEIMAQRNRDGLPPGTFDVPCLP